MGVGFSRRHLAAAVVISGVLASVPPTTALAQFEPSGRPPAPPAPLAGEPAATPQSGDPSAAATPRVRGVNEEARRLLELGVRESPTIAGLVSYLEQSDVVVMVVVGPVDNAAFGDLALVTATPFCRYVRIRVQALDPPTLLSTLGHELQHAREVAEAPDVRCQADMVRLFSRIGHGPKGGPYETPAALEAGRQVLRELRTGPIR